MGIKNIKLNIKILFIIFFIFGINSVKDYGMSYDELEYRQQGFIVLNHLGEKFFPKKTEQIKTQRELNYPTFEQYFGEIKNNLKIQHTFYALVEFIFQKNEKEKRNVYKLRHYLNFIFFFISLIYFYKLLRIFFDRYLCCIGTLLYFLTPRIFANAFYNPNDIFFLIFLMINVYYGLIFYKKEQFKNLVLMSLFTVLSLNVRIIGIYFYFIFIFIFLIFSLKDNKKINYKFLSFQFLLIVFLIYLFTPQIWGSSFFELTDLFIGQLKYAAIDPEILFRDKMYIASNLPWYYIYYWILITSPLIILVFFVIGLVYLIKNYPKIFDKNSKEYFLFVIFLTLLAPLVSLLIFKPSIYNGWRQFYFIWPYILILGIYGIDILFKFGRYTKFTINVFLFLSIVYQANWNFSNHPYQNVYFNYFGSQINSRFEYDYWGLSNLEAYEKILENENDSFKIKPLGGSRIDFALNLLSNQKKNRIELLKPSAKEKPDFYITTFNDGNSFEFYIKNNFREYYSIKVDGIKINSIFTKDF